MSRVLMVIAQDAFRDEEYARPKSVLEAAGHDVVTASFHRGPASGKLGMEAFADIALEDAAGDEWDAVVFVGGAGASAFFDDAHAHKLARDTSDRGSIVAAICIAPSTLARAGLLEGVPATAFASQRDDLVAHGAVWTGDEVTVYGRIVTGNGPDAATAFGEAVARLLDASTQY